METFITKNIWLVAISTSMAIGYAVGFTSIYFFEEYGWTVFVLVPFILGFVPTLFYGYTEEITPKDAFKIGFTTLFLFCLTTLLFAVEGVICIVMASPIISLATLLGALSGYAIVQSDYFKSKRLYSLIVLPAIVLIVDTQIDSTAYLEVKTTIEIEAPIEKVWNNVISFGQIDEPDEWFFKTGISYPTHANIAGEGVGAVRYCNFTTGSFVEPITFWQAPTLLQFDVQDQPTPMREMNPFWDVHPPHLDGYFQSKKGEFQLSERTNGQTFVQGTTWYNIHIHPVGYWDFWSKYILHKIHYRVLEHIKKESEK
ncbi:MAG: hypothetical protein AAGJ93_10095 [Bacteroidota bacterium]